MERSRAIVVLPVSGIDASGSLHCWRTVGWQILSKSPNLSG
jgi:hypothetical protein